MSNDEEKTDPGGHHFELEHEEYRPIPGAPAWAQEGDRRSHQRACVLQANLTLALGEVRGLRERVTSLESRVAELERQTQPAPPPETH